VIERPIGSLESSAGVPEEMLAPLLLFLLAPSSDRVLVVVPLGDPDQAIVDMTVRALADRFRFEVRVAPPMSMPKDAWYAPRRRWRAEKILRALDATNFGDAWRVAAITERPISTTKEDIEDWGIAGLGSLDGKSSVFSGYLYRSLNKRNSEPKYLHAIENLVLHEVGHTLGLPHCPLDRCIMADAHGNALRSAAVSINEFCPRCFEAIRAHLRSESAQGAWTEAERAELRALARLRASDAKPD
jgi:archaemetzincin